MADSSVQFRAGENRPVFGGADAPNGGTLTITDTPSYELIGPNGDTVGSGSVDDHTAGAATYVEASVNVDVDALALEPGVYTCLFVIETIGSDDRERRWRPSVRIEVLAEAPGAGETAYATLAEVQSRIPSELWTGSPDSEPKAADVLAWLKQLSNWVDSGLRWKYEVPITEAEDLAVLAPIVADLAAARVWRVIAGHDAKYAATADQLERFAKQMLAYRAADGRILLVLPSTTESDTGEAARDQPDATFTDPDECGSVPRTFSTRMMF